MDYSRDVLGYEMTTQRDNNFTEIARIINLAVEVQIPRYRSWQSQDYFSQLLHFVRNGEIDDDFSTPEC